MHNRLSAGVFMQYFARASGAAPLKFKVARLYILELQLVLKLIAMEPLKAHSCYRVIVYTNCVYDSGKPCH
jgi:hypothetical protein